MTRTTARSTKAVRGGDSHHVTLRCAVYTRKSTEEGLDQSFNSLDAQREAAEAYIKSQASEGWQIVPTRYDDGGFTGGNLDRPAFQRLLQDIKAGDVDCVVVYKVDRLSRSLLDFSRIMEVFDAHQTAFVSVTQQFNTANSMGRLMLNVLLSFAQFEREIISERTRDKMAAMRRKGKFAGGRPLLGYDIEARTKLLVVNETEATRVRAIFDLYLQLQSMIAVATELDSRGWQNKKWISKAGVQLGGKPFDKVSLHKLLTNVIYAGKIRYKDEIHSGEQPAIVDQVVWQKVQTLLTRNGRTGGAAVRNKFGALLKGLIRCVPCGSAMVPSHTTRNGNKRYRYYVCSSAQKRGWHTCPSKSIPAQEIEKFVVDQIRRVASDPALVDATVEQIHKHVDKQLANLASEQKGLEKDIERWNTEVRDVVRQVGARGDDAAIATKTLDLEQRANEAKERWESIRRECDRLNRQVISQRDVEIALTQFDPVWQALTLRERVTVVQLLVAHVNYDGQTGKVKLAFHPDGMQEFAKQYGAE